MKFTGQLATLVAIIVSAGSALAVTCDRSTNTKTADVRDLHSDLASNGQNYRISGRRLSSFDQVRTARLTMRHINGILGGSMHVETSLAGQTVQNIIDDCCSGQFCCGNDDVRGDQGDNVNINIPC